MWYRALALLALCLWPASSFAALAIDAVSSASCSGCTSLTWAHTTSGTNRGLYAGASYFDSADTISGVTYNAIGMASIPGSLADTGNYSAEGFSLIAPDSGSNNVVITATATMTELSGGAVSFTDANQSAMVGTAATGSGTSTTPTVNVSSAAGEIVVDTLAIVHDGTLTVDASQTQRWNAIAGGFTKYAGSTETGAPTTTMSWGNSTSQAWAISAVPIKEAPASSSVRGLMLLGVGQ